MDPLDANTDLPLFNQRQVPAGLHRNSLAAYQGKDRAALGGRALDILTDLRARGPATDRQLMGRLGFRDMNCVRPRVTELIHRHLVTETGSIPCEVTGKTVRIVAAVGGDDTTPQP